MSPNFIYIPATPQRNGRWINLSLVADIEQFPHGLVLWAANRDEICTLTGEQSRALHLHLTGRAMSHPEPELPNLPDPVIVPPAVRDFDEKVSARGVVV